MGPDGLCHLRNGPGGPVQVTAKKRRAKVGPPCRGGSPGEHSLETEAQEEGRKGSEPRSSRGRRSRSDGPARSRSNGTKSQSKGRRTAKGHGLVEKASSERCSRPGGSSWEGRHEEACGSRGRAVSLGGRGRTAPPPRPVGPLPAGVLLGCVGGRLLWGPCVKLAGQILRVERDRNGAHILLRPAGTDSEQVPENLHVGQGHAFQAARVPGGVRSSGERRLLRARSQRAPGEGRRRGRMGEQPGRTGDRGPDEMAALRKREQELLQARHPQQGEAVEAPGGEGKDPAPEEKEEGKEEEVKGEGARSPKRASAEQSGPERAQQAFTAARPLDPKERVRKTVLKKARRFAGKRKTKRSTSSSSKGSSDSSSTSESLGLGTEGVFAEETKARAISERYPGALTVETLLNMRRLPPDHLRRRGGAEGHQPCGPLVLPERPHQERQAVPKARSC